MKIGERIIDAIGPEIERMLFGALAYSHVTAIDVLDDDTLVIGLDSRQELSIHKQNANTLVLSVAPGHRSQFDDDDC